MRGRGRAPTAPRLRRAFDGRGGQCFGARRRHRLSRGLLALLAVSPTGGRGQQCAWTAQPFGAQHVALVGAVLDLATDALPVLLKGVVALDDVLQPEAPGRVADLLAPQKVDAPVHVLARDGRLDLFEAEKVLLVERAQALESNLELVDLQFVLF